MPKPKAGESKSSFVSRYMRSPHARKRFKKRKQRIAVALATY